MNRKQNKYKQTIKRRRMKLGIIYINAKQNVGDLNEATEARLKTVEALGIPDLIT